MPNLELLYRNEQEAYINVFKEMPEEKFELLIIDGNHREECCEVASKMVKASGIVILDDSQRVNYKAAREKLKEQGFRQLPFFGMAPISKRMKETSLFYRSNNCFGI
jgi:hypothetical protein